MQLLKTEGLRIAGICSCVPARSEDSFARCADVYGSADKARSVVKATGIVSRRIAAPGTSSLDLCVRAAETLLSEAKISADEIGAVVAVTFTPERQMPCNACQAQGRLKLPKDVMAFDINLACSGWAYGLFVAGQLASATGKKVLLLDGDVQTAYVDPKDEATVPLLADAGTATLVAPCAGAKPWMFAFLSDGEKGEALTLPVGGRIAMDGFGVFRFVTMDVLRFIGEFLVQSGTDAADVSAFVPHQANVFMIRQIAKKLRLADKLKLSGDTLGNSASASVPSTIAHTDARGRLLVAGFGGGLSASVGAIDVDDECLLKTVEY